MRPSDTESPNGFRLCLLLPVCRAVSRNLPPELIAQKEDLLKDRVAIEMKRYFGTDFKRIGHASRVARYAEEIWAKKKKATWR